ncbi:MAG: alpha/beta fold hydrolase [Rhodospirillales bacterium]|nr:MAG: alpha/beta fold hydrolase [Rhodospirillales bacterium]
MTPPAAPSPPYTRASFGGVTLEVRDLKATTAFLRGWLPALGFRRIGGDAERVMWARGYEHLMVRQAAPEAEAAGGGVTIGLTAESRAAVEALHRRVAALGVEVGAAPAESLYVAPGYFAFTFKSGDGIAFEISHRWADLPEIEGAERVRVPGDGVTLGGYLFKPEAGVAPHPAVVILHGFGRNAWTDRHVAELAAASGYKALLLSMRGWLGSEGENDQGLRQPGDVIAAIDWLRRLPSVDPGRIGLIGASMGGQVALLAAARRPAIRCVAALFPPSDLDRWYDENPFVRDYLDDIAEPDGLGARSPSRHVAEIDVPVLLMHGDKDENVPLEQSLRLTDSLREAGKDAELLIVSGASHFFSMRESTIARQKLFAFLRAHLGRR